MKDSNVDLLNHENADFEHWSRMPYWTLEEAVALCLGHEPVGSSNATLPPDYDRLFSVAKRASEVGRLREITEPNEFIRWAADAEITIPDELIRLVTQRRSAWFDWKSEAEQLAIRAERAESGFEYYRDLVAKRDAEAKQFMSDNAELQKLLSSRVETSKASALQRSLNTVLRILGGLAIAVYDYNPHDKRHAAASQIQHDLDLKGVNLDCDTIRKWIREGTRLLKTAEGEKR